MANADYLKAALPEPYQILGLRLLPFSLGHWVLLDRLESPFLSSDKASEATGADLITAAWVCAHNWTENVRLLTSGDIWTEAERWLRPTFSQRIARLFGKLPQVDWQKETEWFGNYITAAFSWPTVWVTEERRSKHNSGAPLYQTVKVVLMRELGLTEAEALDKPIVMAMWDYATIGEIEHNVEIYDPAEHNRLKGLANDFDARWREKHPERQ